MNFGAPIVFVARLSLIQNFDSPRRVPGINVQPEISVRGKLITLSDALIRLYHVGILPLFFFWSRLLLIFSFKSNHIKIDQKNYTQKRRTCNLYWFTYFSFGFKKTISTNNTLIVYNYFFYLFVLFFVCSSFFFAMNRLVWNTSFSFLTK